jgi:hypothetical protein
MIALEGGRIDQVPPYRFPSGSTMLHDLDLTRAFEDSKGIAPLRAYSDISSEYSEINTVRGSVTSRKASSFYLVVTCTTSPPHHIDVWPALLNKALDNTSRDFESPARPLLEAAYKNVLNGAKAEAFRLLSGSIEALFVKGKKGIVDEILRHLDPVRAERFLSTGVLRATYRARCELPAWDDCSKRVFDYLEERSEDTKRIMRGLISGN